jgi:shikimate kinase
MGRGSAAPDISVRARNNLLRALGVIRRADPSSTDAGARPFGAFGPVPERIFLVGFMGCGKSTVGHALAERLRWRFIDLDKAAEERAGLPVPKIFLRYGEGHFRRLEYDVLREVSREPGRAIVALGGGTFVSEVNRRVVERSGVSVWLDVPFRMLARRIGAQGGRRPLAQSPDQLYRLHRTRLPFYHEADIRIRAGDASPDAVARSIVRMIREDWPVVVERRKLLL